MSIINLFKKIIDFFLYSGSAQGKYRQELKDMEHKLKEVQPPLYKNGMLLPSFAEAIYQFSQQLSAITNILQDTLFAGDEWVILKNRDFLFSTGFSGELLELYQLLFSDERKQQLLQAQNFDREKENQKKLLEKMIKELNNHEFNAIDTIIYQLDKLYDICLFNYIPLLQYFDKEYKGLDALEAPNFKPIPIADISDSLLDFYYVIYDVNISVTLVHALMALIANKTGQSLLPEEEEDITNRFRIMASLLKKRLSPETIIVLLRLIKKDPLYNPEFSEVKKQYLNDYRERLQIRFIAEGHRIETQIQDEKLQNDIMVLFGKTELLTLKGYSAETNDFLRSTTAYSFFWITPLQILKTYMHVYFNEQVKDFFNTLLIEGYYNNQGFQIAFSSVVHQCMDTMGAILSFEESFEENNQNSLDQIRNYIKDSRKTNDLDRKVKEMVDFINLQAKGIVQTEVKHIYDFSQKLQMLIVDSKKSTPEYISNIRLIISSTKHKDKFDFVEKHYPSLLKFLEIMKNYAIIGSTV